MNHRIAAEHMTPNEMGKHLFWLIKGECLLQFGGRADEEQDAFMDVHNPGLASSLVLLTHQKQYFMMYLLIACIYGISSILIC